MHLAEGAVLRRRLGCLTGRGLNTNHGVPAGRRLQGRSKRGKVELRSYNGGAAHT